MAAKLRIRRRYKEMVKKIIVKQTRSQIGHPATQRRTLNALGLRRIGQQTEHVVNPAIAGMIRTVSHLVDVSPAEASNKKVVAAGRKN
jgi:large subunit ribosomal protein L30